jgi:nitric-oxide synthase, bacterial
MNKPFLGVERVINLEKEQSEKNIKIDEIITKTSPEVEKLSLNKLKSLGKSTKRQVLDKALKFLSEIYSEPTSPHYNPYILSRRINECIDSIEKIGTYRHTLVEMQYGAQLAWKNSARCIGRNYWRQLDAFDYRHLESEEEIFTAIRNHLNHATNGGKLRSSITFFAPIDESGNWQFRIWNEQIIRYAGYKGKDGNILGDSKNVILTEAAMQLGWKPPTQKTAFDILPIIIQKRGQFPKLFELDKQEVMEVILDHPELTWFKDLNLRWHAVPMLSCLGIEIGGINYTAAPFNGWYLGTEIGARNLSDKERYNLLPLIAEKMGLNQKYESTLWRDKALVELNIAVLYSFEKAGVRIVDHHTASNNFVHYEEKEKELGHKVSGEWSWLVPPLSGSACPVFHREYEILDGHSSEFFVQEDLAHNFLKLSSEMMNKLDPSNLKVNNSSVKTCPFSGAIS